MVAREGESFGLRFCIPSRLTQMLAPTSDRARRRAFWKLLSPGRLLSHRSTESDRGRWQMGASAMT